jgi:hypothetical protein
MGCGDCTVITGFACMFYFQEDWQASEAAIVGPSCQGNRLHNESTSLFLCEREILYQLFFMMCVL